jgi:hypothetical protein
MAEQKEQESFRLKGFKEKKEAANAQLQEATRKSDQLQQEGAAHPENDKPRRELQTQQDKRQAAERDVQGATTAEQEEEQKRQATGQEVNQAKPEERQKHTDNTVMEKGRANRQEASGETHSAMTSSYRPDPTRAEERQAWKDKLAERAGQGRTESKAHEPAAKGNDESPHVRPTR